jgi:putative glycosyltransferase (TIGR04348 family)
MAMNQKSKPTVVLVTPALADANNGNWQTAQRWARMLSTDYRVELASRWGASPDAGANPDAMLALHALRSADAIAAFAAAHPDRPLVVALTGTDLYRDLSTQPRAQASLDVSTRIIVLQSQAREDVPQPWRKKTDICFQSTPKRARLRKASTRLRAVMVGHLRSEKDPLTALRAMARLSDRKDIVLDHLGAALDPALGQAAAKAAAGQPNYVWHQGVTHAKALAAIQRAHVLVHPSVMEGGAHVVLEAVQAGTPVIASRMAGNVGMLGKGYAGYFEVGDDAALARLLVRARDDGAWLERLQRQCDKRSALFDPQRERETLRKVMARAFAAKSGGRLR